MADFQQSPRQVTMERLNRRFSSYRTHHNQNSQHYDAGLDATFDENNHQTLALKQRFIESKAKKTTKKSSDNKKQDNSILSNNMGQSKLHARSHDQATGSNEPQENEPAAKKQRLANGLAADISEFQMVQQLHSLKQSNSPAQVNSTSTSVSCSNISNPISTPSLSCSDIVDSVAENSIKNLDAEDIKKENDLDLPNDSLLEGFGEFTNFGDIDMGGINLDDFVSDLDLDNIKHENNDPGIDSFFKSEEFFEDDTSNTNMVNECAVANSNAANNNVPNSQTVKVPTSSSACPSYSSYSTTPPILHTSTAPDCFDSTSLSSSAPTSINSIPSSSSMPVSYAMSNTLPKMRMSMTNMNQNEMSPAAQTLKQMAEPYQTKVSPTNAGRPLAEYGFNSIGNSSVIGQPVSNQGYTNTMNNPVFNQSIGNVNEMEMKRRQQLVHQFSFQHQQQLQNPQINNMNTNIQQMQQTNLSPQQIQQRMILQQNQSHIQPKLPIGQQQQHSIPLQDSPQQQQSSGSTSQIQQSTQLQQANTQLQSHTGKPSRRTPPQQISQPNPTTQPQSVPPLNSQAGTVQQRSPQQTIPQVSEAQTLPVSQQQQTPNQQNSPQTQPGSQQTNQLSNNNAPFNNRLSPMTSYASTIVGSGTQYGTTCNTMGTTGIRGSYPGPPRGSSPLPSAPQQGAAIVAGNQPPRYMQQQMMPVGMMRPQMMAQSGQMISRPPPPEYRQAAMMQQQHQGMVNQPIAMGQMSFMNMRPGYRPNPTTGSPMNNAIGGQLISGSNQQSVPSNMVNMKGGMGNGNMDISINPNNPAAVSAMGGGICQVSCGGMVNTRPPSLMQRARMPNMGMSSMGMGTQMPPSRPEWRQMMIQQGQGGIMVGPGMRHGYQQQTQPGQVISSMQRGPPHMINTINMGMQHNNPGMNPGLSMQGGATMSPVAVSMQGGMVPQRMQQHSMGPQLHTQAQIRMNMPHNQQSINNMTDPRNANMQGHMNSGNLNSMNNGMNPMSNPGSSNLPVMTANNGSVVNPMNNGNVPNIAGNVNINSNTVQSSQRSPSNGMANHPRSPASTGPMHPCSPASGVTQNRPLSNPGMTLSSAQTVLNPQSMGRTPTITSSSSPIISTNARQGMCSMGPTGVRTSNTLVHQTMSPILSQNRNQTQTLGGASGGIVVSGTNNNLLNKNSTGGVLNNTPVDTGQLKVSQPPTPNNDFDLILQDAGEFASLLN